MTTRTSKTHCAANLRTYVSHADPDDPAQCSLAYRDDPARDDIPAPDSAEDLTGGEDA